MIGMLFMALFFSFLLTCSPLVLIILIELGIRRFVRAKSQRSAVWQFLAAWPWAFVVVLVCGLLAALITPLPLQMLIESTIREGTHATYDKAAHGYLHVLPEDAEDINYCSIQMGATADFRISEADFLKWCADQGWSPAEIGQGEYDSPVSIHYRGRVPAEIEFENGLVCDPPRHPRGTGARIVYDRDSGRAYYSYSAW